MSVVRETVIGILLAVGAVHAQNPPHPLLGTGWGLDHMTVMQRSAEDARQSFSKLGFSIRLGTKFPDTGVENSTIPLPPGYLELMWVYDPAKIEGFAKAAGLSAVIEAANRRIQERGGLIQAYNIDVSPIDQAASFLRGRGVKVSLPPSQTVIQDGKAQPGQWQFLGISYENPKSAPPEGVCAGARTDAGRVGSARAGGSMRPGHHCILDCRQEKRRDFGHDSEGRTRSVRSEFRG